MKGLQGFTRVFKGLQGFTGVYKGLQGFSRVYRGLKGFTGVYKGLQGFTRVYKGFQGLLWDSWETIWLGDYMVGYHELYPGGDRVGFFVPRLRRLREAKRAMGTRMGLSRQTQGIWDRESWNSAAYQAIKYFVKERTKQLQSKLS